MGNLSEHFNDRDFICSCSGCQGQAYRIHMGLVGALEELGSVLHRRIRIVSAYYCDNYNDQIHAGKKSFHTQGKAAHIKVEGMPIEALFKMAEKIEPFRGIIFYPGKDYIHVDTRPGEKHLLIKERENYASLTPEKRSQYGLDAGTN